MNKRGQFYLVAAIIIIIAIAGIASVKTYVSVTPRPRNIESMGSELKEEGFRIVDYGISNNKDINLLLDNFTDNYAPYFLKKIKNANVIFLYGNKTNLSSAKYEDVSTGKVSATIGLGSSGWNMDTTFVNRTRVTSVGESITVNIFNKDYTFDTNKDNQMFYFVIVQEKEGEVYIEKS